MKSILVDLNVVLDVLLERQPHVVASGAVWAAIEAGGATGFIAAHSVTTLHYLAGKHLGAAKAGRLVADVLNVFRVAPVDEPVIRAALILSFQDFEDAVTAAAAQGAGCQAIVTRDPAGFRRSPIRILNTEAAATWLS
jgi:predicted nucleic acid-binding protein